MFMAVWARIGWASNILIPDIDPDPDPGPDPEPDANSAAVPCKEVDVYVGDSNDGDVVVAVAPNWRLDKEDEEDEEDKDEVAAKSLEGVPFITAHSESTSALMSRIFWRVFTWFPKLIVKLSSIWIPEELDIDMASRLEFEEEFVDADVDDDVDDDEDSPPSKENL